MSDSLTHPALTIWSLRAAIRSYSLLCQWCLAQDLVPKTQLNWKVTLVDLKNISCLSAWKIKRCVAATFWPLSRMTSAVWMHPDLLSFRCKAKETQEFGGCFKIIMTFLAQVRIINQGCVKWNSSTGIRISEPWFHSFSAPITTPRSQNSEKAKSVPTHPVLYCVYDLQSCRHYQITYLSACLPNIFPSTGGQSSLWPQNA